MYWHKNKDWYSIDKEADQFVLSPDAPERVIKSFRMWMALNPGMGRIEEPLPVEHTARRLQVQQDAEMPVAV
jgi:hypothetical protein